MPAMTTFRAAVDPSHCDFLGHMNVSRYFAACSDAVFALQAELGLTPDDMRSGRRLSFAVVHAESDFRAELLAGDLLRMETDIVAIGTKSMSFRHRLYRCPDETLSFEATFKGVLLSLDTRRAVEVPQDLRDRAAAFLAG
ncbi:acyl-CoA thioesterase [Antarctobacter heliothermus]|uniref:Acyl-CoA thioester hydrolase n=1 Tax=Antarctobacter heliothermus TaxID=74033 RepID=A0A239CP24_9RHOB|nr:thioesterase family protein [Antarctobacter heliothermus]SNS21887.1 acyl-CoA thioester hydrolase [Antarctobacter heliothermus]